MIDVVIPICGGNIRLELMFWGLSQQTNNDFIVHIVDNHLNLNALPLINKYSNIFKINYYKTQNTDLEYKPCHTRNLGIMTCASERILFLSGDVVPSSTLIEAHSNSIGTTEILVGSCKTILESNLKWLHYKLSNNILNYDSLDSISIEDRRMVSKNLSKLYLALSSQCIDTYPFSQSIRNAYLCDYQNISYNTTIVKQLGGFCEQYDGFLGGGDHDLAIRAIRSKCSVKTIPPIYVYHLDHKPRAEENQIRTRELLNKSATDVELVRNNGPIL